MIYPGTPTDIGELQRIIIDLKRQLTEQELFNEKSREQKVELSAYVDYLKTICHVCMKEDNYPICNDCIKKLAIKRGIPVTKEEIFKEKL